METLEPSNFAQMPTFAALCDVGMLPGTGKFTAIEAVIKDMKQDGIENLDEAVGPEETEDLEEKLGGILIVNDTLNGTPQPTVEKLKGMWEMMPKEEVPNIKK